MLGRNDTVVLVVILLLFFFAVVAWLLFWARGPVTIWLTRKTEVAVDDPETSEIRSDIRSDIRSSEIRSET
ncbi:hypothetical protein TWF696_006949 [Orbilia brochopaga]|uniref:ATP synthase F0 subunit 8 n=1 Tax=Orbilia brochopaga TaxID=3140254 RepID=A0AAV9UQD5_9PEZI